MLCPKCDSEEIQVIDSRDVDKRTIRRRRVCNKCKFRFSSYERIESARLSVIKRDGRIEAFDRDKIISGIRIASNERVSDEEILKIANTIELKLIEDEERMPATKKIGNMVIAKLKKLDEVSYLRFKSVYKNFEDIDSFEEELIKLKK